MCCESEYNFCIFTIISFVFLAIGAPCWGVSASKNYFVTTDSFISIPIFPETEGGFEKYGAVQYVEGQSFYPDQESYSITISTQNLYQNLDNDLELYIFHNLWGISYSLDVLSENQNVIFSHSYSSNFNPEDGFNSEILSEQKQLKDYAGDLIYFNFAYIYCPYPTLYTRELRIDNFCKSQSYPVNIKTKFNAIKIGENDFESNHNLTFRFNNLECYPKNFIETPQILIGGYSSTNKQALLICGILFSLLGIILFIIGSITTMCMEML